MSLKTKEKPGKTIARGIKIDQNESILARKRKQGASRDSTIKRNRKATTATAKNNQTTAIRGYFGDALKGIIKGQNRRGRGLMTSHLPGSCTSLDAISEMPAAQKEREREIDIYIDSYYGVLWCKSIDQIRPCGWVVGRHPPTITHPTPPWPLK